MSLTNRMPEPWDYLIVTASNDFQASAYEAQLDLRRQMGYFSQVREVLVVGDPGGKRIGSGGSTIHCLMEIVNRELDGRRNETSDGLVAERILRGLRILIIHAGGDAKRLPAYGPCGKIFAPLPGESESALGQTLLDRLAPIFLGLPSAPDGQGQVVVAAGDALILFDSAALDFTQGGMTLLGCHTTPEEASRHGVFCVDGNGALRLFLQKPPLDEQARASAVNRYRKTILDIGITSFDAATAARLLSTFGVRAGTGGTLAWSGSMKDAIFSHGLDLYREICCALGSEATVEHYLRSARASSSSWVDATLEAVYAALRDVSARVQVVPRCSFLHFGTTRQLVSSGLELVRHDQPAGPAVSQLSVNNEIQPGVEITGSDFWVEGCQLRASLTLGGDNVVVGVDVDEPLALLKGACLDVVEGRGRDGEAAWFVRCYGVNDAFKDSASDGTLFCGRPLMTWLSTAGAKPEEIWDGEDRSLWSARVFPAERRLDGYRRWLWMFDVESATPEQKQAFLSAERYSAAEITLLADQEAFHLRRARIRAEQIRRSLRDVLRGDSNFPAEDLAYTLSHAEERAAWVADLLSEAHWHLGRNGSGNGMESFVSCRIIHSLGSAVEWLVRRDDKPLSDLIPGLPERLDAETSDWLKTASLSPEPGVKAAEWGGRLRAAAFRELNDAILRSSLSRTARPRNALRPDETIWGRAPARLELGGGWTDTPPYSLERGGDVANAAVNLHGQPPIHCYCRVIEEPVIRLSAIDVGQHIEIRDLDELLDYRRPGDGFALAKAALAISGFSPEFAEWPEGITLRGMLEEFGGGIEMTTLVGIPKGSGLGTSSILGAVIIAVMERMMGRTLTQRELFHDVLRLEQALTTGGGWQDQIGGGVGGTKITSTAPGLIADPRIHYIPDDLLDPKANGGCTLLYYTGLTRLAKNILEQIVGGYFNRNRTIMAALEHEHQVARCIADAMARKDAALFGHYINVAWRLQKQLCSDVSNEMIESLMDRVRPFVHGMRISGAGSGGFLLMICKSPSDAVRARDTLEREPLNERSRFFDFDINRSGLEVSTC